MKFYETRLIVKVMYLFVVMFSLAACSSSDSSSNVVETDVSVLNGIWDGTFDSDDILGPEGEGEVNVIMHNA